MVADPRGRAEGRRKPPPPLRRSSQPVPAAAMRVQSPPPVEHPRRKVKTVAIIGHGRSPEGKNWHMRINACDVVVRMWDWKWQSAIDYGTKWDFGFFEVHQSLMTVFHKHRKEIEPHCGWVASLLGSPERCVLPERTELVDQKKWNDMGRELGGCGETGRLQFTRGTIAVCWACEKFLPGAQIILVGFDNIELGKALPLQEAFSPAYRKNLGTFSFNSYKPNVSKYGNHDYAIELPVMRKVADLSGQKLVSALDTWD